MRCMTCGTNNADGSRFCGGCGAELTSRPRNLGSEGYSALNSTAPKTYNASSRSVSYPTDYRSSGSPAIPPEYKPISMWGYFGYELLFLIPIAGFIILLVFAFGGTQNVNLRNFARSYFCLAIIIVIVILYFFVIGLSGVSLLSRYW